MNSTNDPNFHDPALKHAVRRAWADEKCPANLRARLAQTSNSHRDSYPLFPLASFLAAAAVVVIVVGLGFILLGRTGNVAVASTLPPLLAKNLDATHDHCCALPDHHHVLAPKDDFKLIGQSMASSVHHSVVSAGLGSDWTFKGAALCGVGDEKSAHLVFSKGSEKVSVFSLSADSCSGKEGCLYECIDATHPAAGFVRDGALIVVVGSNPGGAVGQREIAKIRDQLLNVAPIKQSTALAGVNHELMFALR